MKKYFLTKKFNSLTVIAPEKSLLLRVKTALSLIKKIDSKAYKNVSHGLKVIFITGRYGYTNEFFMPEKIWFANKSVIAKNDIRWLASLIIHEAFHATQFKKGSYTASFPKLEKRALAVQERFLKKLKDPYAKRDIKIVVRQKYWKRMNEDKNSFVYFRNLLSLFEQNRLILKR